MGFYITTDSSHDKAMWILNHLDGIIVPPEHVAEPPPGHVPVVIVDNVAFEAAGIAFDSRELERFVAPDIFCEQRRRWFMHVPIKNVVENCPAVKNKINWP